MEDQLHINGTTDSYHDYKCRINTVRSTTLPNYKLNLGLGRLTDFTIDREVVFWRQYQGKILHILEQQENQVWKSISWSSLIMKLKTHMTLYAIRQIVVKFIVRTLTGWWEHRLQYNTPTTRLITAGYLHGLLSMKNNIDYNYVYVPICNQTFLL